MTLYGYDTISRLNSLSYKYNGIYEHEYTTSYIADNRITSFKLSSGQNDIFTVNPVFDGLGRQTARTLKNGSGAQVDKEAYSFVAGAGGANASTSMIASVGYYGSDSTVDETYTYTYDNIGNIRTVSKNGTQIASYTYNSLNELTGYTDAAGTVHTYEYSDGNRLQYNERTALLYEDDVWLDRVTTIIDAETYDDFAVTYDAIGNTLSYRNGMSFTWKNGRQLATYTQGQTSASYNYNESGIRTDKTVNGITTTYQLDGSKIVSENRNGNIIQYYYDETNSVIGLRYNGNDYFFRRNIQTDIISILNSSGTVVVSYEYDPWGNILSVTGSMASTLGVDNPFRYRSYYYDTESGLYYVSSRYYDPEVGRYLNADSVIAGVGGSVQGYNLFAYCFNNPVNMSDISGHWPQWIKDAANWGNNNIVQPVANFFSPKTNTISGQFQDGIFRGSGSLTGGYNEFNGRLQINSKDSKNNGMLGGYGKVSVGNANGKIGIGSDNAALSVKGVGDALTATAQAGIQYKNGAGLAAKAKASVLSGRATAELELFGWQIEFGVSGDLLSVGAEAMIGVFPDEGFTAKASVGAGLFDGGFVFRVKPKQ